MSVSAGEAIVLCCVALLNIFVFSFDGWPCGKIYSQECLETSNLIPVVVILFKITIVLSIIAATAQTIPLFINLQSTSTHKGLLLASKVLTCLVANLDVYIVFFYYSHMTVCYWSPIIAALCAGMVLAVAITKLCYDYKVFL